jgi:hypothetical protein
MRSSRRPRGNEAPDVFNDRLGKGVPAIVQTRVRTLKDGAELPEGRRSSPSALESAEAIRETVRGMAVRDFFARPFRKSSKPWPLSRRMIERTAAFRLYRVNYRHGTPTTEFVTDDLNEGLARGREMATPAGKPTDPPLGPTGRSRSQRPTTPLRDVFSKKWPLPSES